ncbi:GAP family protein [Blastococcus sp. URHD0036]|uniref:GAP family protein n=1 Tax=Blastococcus sp. URHD0036 TaxID=1380356 RepID=UPI000495D4E3|nr:GAP family protein [Blastococcus sp. URHD0036]
MSTQALLLAAVSIVRPTTAAAVWAMLVGARPRRLLACYLAAGMALSLTVGAGVVLFVSGVLSPRDVSAGRPVLLLALGAVALVLGLACALGWVGEPRTDRPRRATRTHRLTPLGAATAGVLTHLPGVFYLAGLSAITATGAGAGGAVLQVVVYNLVWFSPAIVALGICLTGTAPRPDRLEAPLAWGRAHQAALLAAISSLVGVWLVVEGVADLG